MSIFCFFCIGIATLFAAIMLLASAFFYGTVWLSTQVSRACAHHTIALTPAQRPPAGAQPLTQDDDTEVIVVPANTDAPSKKPEV